MDWLWGTGWFWLVVFWVALLVNARAAFKLLLDWKGMRTTIRFVEGAYRDLDALPDETTERLLVARRRADRGDDLRPSIVSSHARQAI